MNDGTENLDAAQQAFGDLDEFELALAEFVRTNRNYRRSAALLTFDATVAVEELDDGDSELVEFKLLRFNDKDVEERLASLQEITSGSKPYANAWYELAQAKRSIAYDSDDGLTVQALSDIGSDLAKAVSINPSHMHAHVMLGEVWMEQSEIADNADASDELVQKAIASFRLASALDSDHPWPVYNLSRALRYTGRHREERGELLERAFDLAPESGQIRFDYAAYLANNGKFDEAIGLLAIIANDPHGRGGSAASFIERLEAYRADAEPEDDDAPSE